LIDQSKSHKRAASGCWWTAPFCTSFAFALLSILAFNIPHSLADPFRIAGFFLLRCQVTHLTSFFLTISTVIGLLEVIERDRKFIKINSIDKELSHVALGIDASHYIRQLYLRDSIQSSLSAALGGVPIAFKAEVEKDLKVFRQYKIIPRFVFDGLDLNHYNSRKDKSIKAGPIVEKRNSAWDAWTNLAEKAESKDLQETEKATRDAFKAGISLWELELM